MAQQIERNEGFAEDIGKIIKMIVSSYVGGGMDMGGGGGAGAGGGGGGFDWQSLMGGNSGTGAAKQTAQKTATGTSQNFIGGILDLMNGSGGGGSKQPGGGSNTGSTNFSVQNKSPDAGGGGMMDKFKYPGGDRQTINQPGSGQRAGNRANPYLQSNTNILEQVIDRVFRGL